MRLLIVLLGGVLAVPAVAAPTTSYFPLSAGAVWVRRGDDGVEVTAKVVGPRTVGDRRCVVIETRSERQGRERVIETCYLATPREVVVLQTTAGPRTIRLDPPRPLQLLPPAAGKAWTWSPRNAPVPVRVNDRWVREETVRVRAGTFRAWRVESVTIRGDTTVTVVTWYAPGVGVVKVERQQAGPGGDREGGSELIRYRIP